MKLHGHYPPAVQTDGLLFLESLIDKIPSRLVNETASEWMERKMVVVEGPFQGPYSFRRTPYLREIADNLSIQSSIQESVLIKANQVGGSELSYGVLCYYVDMGIGPQLFVSGDASMAEEAFEKRLDPIIESAGLRDKIRAVVKKSGASRVTGDTKGVKAYNGTFLRAVGPNSEGKLRSFPSRINVVEELDVFPQSLKGAGNPVEKVVRRADSFGPNKRIYYNSTPKAKATSQILPLVEAGDKRLYMWHCPKCGQQQAFLWGGFHWDKTTDGAPRVDMDDHGRVLHDPVYYECANPECKYHITNAEKTRLLLDAPLGGTAEWVPTKKPDRPGIRSYILPAFYGFRSWLDIVLQWWRVKDDPLLLPDFINDVLAECWEEVRDKPEPHYLMQRAEPWEFGHIPERVYFLTAAADIQGNRIEAELMGWGANKEGWILDYRVWEGNTEDPSDPCWNHLAEFIEEDRRRADGVFLGGPMVTFVDAGFLQSVVNHFCSGFTYLPRVVNGVYPVIGRESMGSHAYKLESNDINTPLVAVDDQKFKKVVYSFLRREPPPEGSAFPNGYIHFPSSLGEIYYQQLTAEDWIETTNRDGKKISKIANPHQRRNEALDVTKLNYAALYYMCLHWYEVQNKKRKIKHLRELEINWTTFLEGMKPDATV